PEEWITFIVAYRQVGPSQSTTTVIGAGNSPASANTPSATATTQPTGDLNMDLQPQTPIGGILDLIGAQVQYTFLGAPAPSTLNSPFTTTDFATYLPQLMDYCTVNPAATIPGRININQCSATVLAGIPGM